MALFRSSGVGIYSQGATKFLTFSTYSVNSCVLSLAVLLI
nr:MAG TPA: hypothetical protein [Caudoviricetes sp.]